MSKKLNRVILSRKKVIKTWRFMEAIWITGLIMGISHIAGYIGGDEAGIFVWCICILAVAIKRKL